MATFIVHNITTDKLAVPPPVARLIPAGGTVTVEAHSLDTDAIQALIDKSRITVIASGPDGASEAAIESAPASAAAAPTTRLGATGDFIILGAGDTATLTHDLGLEAATIDVYDSVGINFTADADLTITQADVNTLAVQSTAGGSFVIVCSWDEGTLSLGSTLLSTDSRIVVA
jgi:hypothetical protein